MCGEEGGFYGFHTAEGATRRGVGAASPQDFKDSAGIDTKEHCPFTQ